MPNKLVESQPQRRYRTARRRSRESSDSRSSSSSSGSTDSSSYYTTSSSESSRSRGRGRDRRDRRRRDSRSSTRSRRRVEPPAPKDTTAVLGDRPRLRPIGIAPRNTTRKDSRDVRPREASRDAKPRGTSRDAKPRGTSRDARRRGASRDDDKKDGANRAPARRKADPEPEKRDRRDRRDRSHDDRKDGKATKGSAKPHRKSDREKQPMDHSQWPVIGGVKPSELENGTLAHTQEWVGGTDISRGTESLHQRVTSILASAFTERVTSGSMSTLTRAVASADAAGIKEALTAIEDALLRTRDDAAQCLKIWYAYDGILKLFRRKEEKSRLVAGVAYQWVCGYMQLNQMDPAMRAKFRHMVTTWRSVLPSETNELIQGKLPPAETSEEKGALEKQVAVAAARKSKAKQPAPKRKK